MTSIKLKSKKFDCFMIALADLGYEPKPYSGRCMYGTYCVGIVIDENKNTYQVISEIVNHLNTVLSDEYTISDELIFDYFRNTKVDNLGYDYIMYFQNIEVLDETN